jgi:pimeloyl-ACP methyl ester carboxylesterase
MSKVKVTEEESFKEKHFNGERARWEDYHRYLRITINKQEDLPENWLNYIFEEYPFAAWYGFLKIKKQIRNNIEPIFLIGEYSDTCNPKSKNWIKLFFPNLKWHIIPNGGHMFPFERQDETINLFRNIFFNSLFFFRLLYSQ